MFVYGYIEEDEEGNNMNEASIVKGRGLSEDEKQRFANVRTRAEKLGVLDINFCGAAPDSLVSYECTLDIAERHKARLDQNAGEA